MSRIADPPTRVREVEDLAGLAKHINGAHEASVGAARAATAPWRRVATTTLTIALTPILG